MRARQITFVGNCQAQAMATLYRDHAAPELGDVVRYFDDHDVPAAAVREGIAGTDLLVVQDRDFNHGLSADELPAGLRVVMFPQVLAGFLWPFATEAHVQNAAIPPFPDGPYPPQLGDSFLNRLIRRGTTPEAALDTYAELDVARVANLDRLFELYMDKQGERDRRTGYEVMPVVLDRFRHEPLFRTPHHPNATLFGVVARQLFERLDVPVAVTEVAAGSLHRSPFPDDELPLHPAVIAHYRLRFADETTRYAFHAEGRFTFREWVPRYVAYAHNHSLREAIAGLGADDPAASVAALDAALPLSPGSVHGWRARGTALARLGRAAEAEASFAHAAALDPEDGETLAAHADMLLQRGQVEDAAAMAARAVALAPRLAVAQELLGEAHLRLGDAPAAAAALAQAVRLAPGRAAASQLLGVALMQAGDAAGAEAAARRAVRLAPERSEYRNALAEALEALGRRAEAIAALLDGPRDAQSYSLLGNFRERDGDHRGAAEAFAEGVRLAPERADLARCLADARARVEREAA